MKTKRRKPHVGATLDRDVIQWLTAQAKQQRMTVSAFLNRVLADAMERGAPKAA